MASMREVNGVDMVTVEDETGQGSYDMPLNEYQKMMGIDPRQDSKRCPHYKGKVPHTDDGCENVYSRRSYYKR